MCHFDQHKFENQISVLKRNRLRHEVRCWTRLQHVLAELRLSAEVQGDSRASTHDSSTWKCQGELVKMTVFNAYASILLFVLLAHRYCRLLQAASCTHTHLFFFFSLTPSLTLSSKSGRGSQVGANEEYKESAQKGCSR